MHAEGPSACIDRAVLADFVFGRRQTRITGRREPPNPPPSSLIFIRLRLSTLLLFHFPADAPRTSKRPRMFPSASAAPLRRAGGAPSAQLRAQTFGGAAARHKVRHRSTYGRRFAWAGRPAQPLQLLSRERLRNHVKTHNKTCQAGGGGGISRAGCAERSPCHFDTSYFECPVSDEKTFHRSHG